MEEPMWRVSKNKKTIIGWDSQDLQIQVPDKIDGVPVTEIGDYAFSQNKCQEIYLPASIKKIGRYAFYNCFYLKKLFFYTAIRDIGAGAFTGCHRVRELDVTVIRGEKSCFRDILSEFSEEVLVHYHGEQEAKLMFPEFYEEGVENTPARILMTKVHGSGIHYRNCFVNGNLDFHEYDSLFYRARAQESEEFSLRLSMCRLFYPYQLEKKYEQDYREYLRKHLDKAGCYLVRTNDLDGIRSLLLYFFQEPCDREALEKMILLAQEEKRAEILSYLMEEQHRRYLFHPSVFEL